MRFIDYRFNDWFAKLTKIWAFCKHGPTQTLPGREGFKVSPSGGDLEGVSVTILYI